MAFEWPENNVNFGVPGIDPLEQTLSNLYDPYSGINLLDDYRETCDYLEIMLLPNGAYEDSFFCQDEFSSTGPVYFGGTGGLGNCFNNGTVNVRYLGGYGGDGNNTQLINIFDWIREETVTEPFIYYAGGLGDVWPKYWTPNVWGYEFDDDLNPSPQNQINISKHSIQQLSSFNFNFLDGTSPFSGNIDPIYNLAEMRSYFKSEENGEYRFCFSGEGSNQAGVFINDGATTDLLLQEYGSIPRDFEKTLSSTQLYKILVRHYQETGISSFNMAFQSPSSRLVYGDLPCNEEFYKDIHPGVSKVIPTTIDPPIQQEWIPGEISGDGLYYETNQTPFAGTEEISNYLQLVDCNTIFDIELFNFDEVRAVCKDGSYVTIASSNGGLPVLTPYGTSDEISTQTFINPTKSGNTVDTITDEQEYALQQQGQLGYDWFPIDYQTQQFPLGVWDTNESITQATADEFCKEQGYNQGAISYEVNGELSPNFGRHIGDDEGGFIKVHDGNGECRGPYPSVSDTTGDGLIDSVSGWDDWCNAGSGLFYNFSGDCDDYDFQSLQYRHDNSSPTPEHCCAELYGTGLECLTHCDNANDWSGGEIGVGVCESALHYDDDFRMWPQWWSRSNNPEDYLAELVGYTNDNHAWYKCLDNIATYEQPSVTTTMVYWMQGGNQDWGWIIAPWADTQEGGTDGEGNASLLFLTSVTCENDGTQDSDFIYESGEQACRTMEKDNSNMFFSSDADGRQSLALINTMEDNKLDNNFQSSLIDETFNPIEPTNRLKNSTGVSETGVIHNITTQTFGKEPKWLDGKPLNTYYPDSWEHIAITGGPIGTGAQGSNPLSDNQIARWQQSPTYDAEQPFNAYGAYFPYVFPNVGLEWNYDTAQAPRRNGDGLQGGWFTSDNHEDDENVTLETMPRGEEVASIAHDYQWARWVKSESECFSYDKCLKFQADEKWDDIQLLLDESGATGPNVCPTWSDIYIEGEGGNCENGVYLFTEGLDEFYHNFKGKNTYNILKLGNKNQYRTINQSQTINQEGLSQYSSLKVSFMMKTMEDALYDSENPPEVEAGLLKVNDSDNIFLGYDGDTSTPVWDYSLDSGMGYQTAYESYIDYDIGLYEYSECGFAFRPVAFDANGDVIEGTIELANSFGWLLATDAGPAIDGTGTFFDSCHVDFGANAGYACSGIPIPPGWLPNQQVVNDFNDGIGGYVYSAADIMNPERPGKNGKCLDINAFQFTYPDTLSCYDEFFNPYDSEDPSTYYWLDAVYFGNRDFCTDPAFPYCTVYYDSPNSNTQQYVCTSWITPPAVEDLSMHNNNNFIPEGEYNSYTHTQPNPQDDFGGIHRFKNKALNTWEKKEFTFNPAHFDVEDFQFSLTFFVQAGNENFKGTVYLDNFEVIESQEFIPDVDVRKYLGPNRYGKGSLTEYYDPTIPEQLEAYNDTTAPLEAQFYFYPRYYKENVFDKTSPVFNDFRKGMFYLYNIDWGDNSPIDFLSEPKQLGDEEMVYHTYEKSGIYEITGFMLRLKYNEQEDPLGVIHNKRFTLKINVNEGFDEDFEYFGSDGFSFIPYQKTTPIIGGVSKQSIYYKSIKRNLGILDEEKIQTSFKSVGDRLKTEIALSKIDNEFENDFEVLPDFQIQRTTNADGTGDVIYNGIKTYFEELGDSLGDTDITSIKYFNKPKDIWEFFTGGPGSDSYEEFIDPSFEPEEDLDEEEVVIPDDILPDDYGSGEGGVQNFCFDQNACNYQEIGDCIYPSLNTISITFKTATEYVFEGVMWNYSGEGEDYYLWTHFDQMKADYNAEPVVYNTEGRAVYVVDFSHEGIVSTGDIINSMVGDETNSSLFITIKEINLTTFESNTIFVNKPWYEAANEDEAWFSDSPYAVEELFLRENHAYYFIIDNRIALTPDPFNDGLSFRGNTGDTITLPYQGCPTNTPIVDMNNYPFGSVPAGGQCITTLDCQQYPEEPFIIGPGDFEGDEYPISFYVNCMEGICQLPCESRTIPMPCWSDDQCNDYDNYGQPGCIPFNYHCSFAENDMYPNGQGTCAFCEYSPNPQFFNRSEELCNGEYCLWPLIDGECVWGGGAACPESGNTNCYNNICQGGLNSGESCVPNDPDNGDYSSEQCPPIPNPYAGMNGEQYAEICASATSEHACVGNVSGEGDYLGGGANEELKKLETGCDEDYFDLYYCGCIDSDCPGNNCDNEPNCNRYYNSEEHAESMCPDYGDISFQANVYMGEDPGQCKYRRGINLGTTIANLCPDGTTCQTVENPNPDDGLGQYVNLCIDDSITYQPRSEDGESFLNKFQTSMRSNMHPGNPASQRYWNNIYEGDIFSRYGIEEVTRYGNTSNKYLETLPMPYYFEEFDYDGNGTLSLGVDGVLWRDEAKRPDIYERLELLLNDGDEDTPPHFTLQEEEDDEDLAEDEGNEPGREGENLITGGNFSTVNSLDNFEVQTILGNEINGVDNGLVTMEWVDNAVKFTVLDGVGNCIDNQCDNGANGLDGNGYCEGHGNNHCSPNFKFTQEIPFQYGETYRLSYRIKASVPGHLSSTHFGERDGSENLTTDYQTITLEEEWTPSNEDSDSWGIGMIYQLIEHWEETHLIPFSFTIDDIIIQRTSGYFGELRPIENFENPSIIRYVDINTYSEQTWTGINTTIPNISNTYYYPVLPKYLQTGEFSDPPSYPNNNTPFPIDGVITTDNHSEDSLKMSITSETIDTNIYNDLSGQGSYGFTMNDYKPRFDDETLEVKNVRNMGTIRTSTQDGAF